MIDNNYQNNYGYSQPNYANSLMGNYTSGNNFQQTTALPQRPVMKLSGGRIVRNEQDIFPNEVPNNGNIAVFVQEDLNTIFLKTWGRSGLIDTNVYQLVTNDPQQNAQNPFDQIMVRLDAIENFLLSSKSNDLAVKKSTKDNQAQNELGGNNNE